MSLEQIFHRRLQALTRLDGIAVRHVEFRPPLPSAKVGPLLADLAPKPAGALKRLYEEHDGIELEWDGTLEDLSVHGSLNICGIREAVERIGAVETAYPPDLEPFDRLDRSACPYDVEQMFGQDAAIFVSLDGRASASFYDGLELSPLVPSWPDCLTALVESLGHDAMRPILTRPEWRSEARRFQALLEG